MPPQFVENSVFSCFPSVYISHVEIRIALCRMQVSQKKMKSKPVSYKDEAAIVLIVGGRVCSRSSSLLSLGESWAKLPWMRRLASFFCSSVMCSSLRGMSGAHWGSSGEWPTAMPTRICHLLAAFVNQLPTVLPESPMRRWNSQSNQNRIASCQPQIAAR